MPTVLVTSGTIIHAGATYRPGETFDIEASEAARLVKLGVAEIVVAAPEPTPEPVDMEPPAKACTAKRKKP